MPLCVDTVEGQTPYHVGVPRQRQLRLAGEGIANQHRFMNAAYERVTAVWA